MTAALEFDELELDASEFDLAPDSDLAPELDPTPELDLAPEFDGAPEFDESSAWPDSDEPPAPARRSVLDSGTVAVADLVRPIDALGRRAVPPLPVAPALQPVLPEGLRRGSTVAVRGSVSLLLALLGGPSGNGAWCALVGLPSISAEAAAEYGVDLSRLALVAAPGPGWLTAVGALLDAVDIVVVRPPARVTDGDLRRLAARTRGRAAVLMPYLGDGEHWPRADVEVELSAGQWNGVGSGHGRLRARAVTVTARGRAAAARPRSAQCLLPALDGGIGTAGGGLGTAVPRLGVNPLLRAG